MLPNAEAVARLTDVAAGWLLTYIVHSTIILAGVWVIASRRRVSDTVRDILWKSALVGGILTASIQTAVAREPLGGQLRLAPRTASRLTATVSVARAPGAATRFLVVQPRGQRWTAGLLVVWLTGAGAALLWLTFGHGRTLRSLGERLPLDGSPVGRHLRELLTAAGIDRQVTLTCSAAIASPVALPGDEICLPRRALVELEPAEQESMLAHEAAHLVRCDPQWLVAARTIEAVLFFQPLNRLARRHMQEVAEYLCDDWAVARTSRPVTLAKCLAAVAEWVGRAPRTAAPRLRALSAMVESGGSPLVRRVGRILSRRRAPHRRTSRLAFASAALVLTATAAVVPRVSIAHPSPVVFAVLRARGELNDAVVGRGRVYVREIAATRVPLDSIATRTVGAAAGSLGHDQDVLVQRIVIDTASVVDMGDGERHLRSASPSANDPANDVRPRHRALSAAGR